MKKITKLFSLLVFITFGWRQANAQFTEDFEGTFLPVNWSKDTYDAANDITQSTSENHTPSGVNSARFSSYNSASDYNQYLFTHQFTVTAPNTELRFWHIKPSGSDILEWGVSTTTDTLTAVTAWNSVVLSTAWTEEVVDLSSFVGQTIYFAFHYYGNYQYYVYLDDVTLSAPPTCIPPTALITANLLATSVDLSWSSAATSWEIEYDTTGFTQGTGTAVVTATNPHSLTGLNATTSYDFYVRDICGAGDTSTWVGPINFVTPCAVFTPNYLEDFTTFTPACWKVAGGGTPATGPTGLGTSGWRHTNYLNTGGANDAVKINLYTTGSEEWLLSPTFDLSAGGWELVINSGVTTWNGTAAINMGSDDTVQVLLSIDEGLTWSTIHSWDVNNQPTNTGSFTSIDLSAYTGTNNQFAIWTTEGVIDDLEDFDFHINDFEIRIPPTCIPPTTLMTANLIPTSVDLSWTSTATSWEIEYDTTGFPQGTGTAVVTATNPHSLTGLTAATSYDFYVRDICGAGDTSAWVGPINFVTPCIAPIISAFPYSENFDSETAPAIPCGWTRANDNGDANQWMSSTVIPNSGTNSLYLEYDFSLASNDWVFTPELQLTAGITYDITFAYRARSANFPESLSMSIGMNRDSVSMTTVLFDSTNFSHNTYDTITVSHTAATTASYFVGFFGYSSANQFAIGVDDFSIDISTITTISSINKSIVLEAYPNPNSGVFTLNVNTTNIKELNIQVMNAQGQVVYTKNNFKNIANVNEQIDLSNNAKGIYFINVTSDKGVKTHKVIVQ
ncbi:MAG: hypothetical protein COB15_01950 [Flavobacteriales bacterium]|nr:MAG: hypothetical protein COB15_01950 [Flavobacteriales bacterium]